MVNCIGGGDAMKLYETSLLPVDVGFDVKDHQCGRAFYQYTNQL